MQKKSTKMIKYNTWNKTLIKKIQLQPDSNPWYDDSQQEPLTNEPLFHGLNEQRV